MKRFLTPKGVIGATLVLLMFLTARRGAARHSGRFRDPDDDDRRDCGRLPPCIGSAPISSAATCFYRVMLGARTSLMIAARGGRDEPRRSACRSA